MFSAKFTSDAMPEEEVLGRTILRIRHGSNAYGLNIASSDIDEKGVCIPYLDNYFGLRTFEQKDKGWSDGRDRVIYEIRKFCRLALNCNPNIVELMFVHPEDILHVNYYGRELLRMRDNFLSRQARKSFGGYAVHQLKSLKEDKFDTKDAMHLLRLTRMCKEIITTGQVIVRRPDRDFLLSVRDGKVPYKQIVEEAEANLAEADAFLDKSPLPEQAERGPVELFLERSVGALAKKATWQWKEEEC